MHRSLSLLAAATVAGVLATAACDGPTPNNPYVTTVGGGGGGGEGGAGGGTTVDPELGGPCVSNDQCDDGIACTEDSCDPKFDRCRFHPEPEPCDDGIHCNGVEVCDGKLGCRLGPPVDCGDDNLCSIDTCVEETQSCKHEARDADGDGDPDGHCPDGGDCDDFDPLISSLAEEVCGNALDDDCDLATDEAGCATPTNDTCLDALVIDSSGSYPLTTFGANDDYPTGCTPAGAVRDVVAAIILPPGPALDVIARTRTPSVGVSVGLVEQCGDAATEITCGGPFLRPGGGQVARLHGRSLGGGGEETALPLYVTTVGGSEVTLDVSFTPATTQPTNETCGTAAPLVLDAGLDLEIVDATKDLETACVTTQGELVYSIEVEETSDLDIWGLSLDGDGQVSLSLRDSACALPEDELSCHTATSAHVFRHSVEPGTYYVSVSATAPTTLNLLASLSPPTAPPPDEDCDAGALLVENVTVDLSFDEHQDDHLLGCFQAAVDAAYELDIDEPSDVLLVQRISAGDAASVGLALPGCTEQDALSCVIGGRSPLRARKRNVAAGDYRVIAESLFGLPQQLTAFVRPYAPATLVVFADDCAAPQQIPAEGGFFQGNTSNLAANFSAGCDSSGNGPAGARDQLLRLDLSETKRVILDMTGSTYGTLLDVRKGPTCPGVEVPGACSASVSSDTSYLDLTLDQGTYFLQVDGLGGATGAWMLDVHVVDPS